MSIWIDTNEAARLLSEYNGRPIPSSYVRTLAKKNMIESKAAPDEIHLLVKRSQVESRRVWRRVGRRVEERVRDQRTGRPPGRPRKEA